MKAKPLWTSAAAIEAAKAVALCTAFALWGFPSIGAGPLLLAQALSGSVFAALAMLGAGRGAVSGLGRIALPWKAATLAPSILAFTAFQGRGTLPGAEDLVISLLLLAALLLDLACLALTWIAAKGEGVRAEAGGQA